MDDYAILSGIAMLILMGLVVVAAILLYLGKDPEDPRE